MQIYHYHPATGVLLYASDADQSPLEENVFLIPANATDIEPPVAHANQVPVFSAGAWMLEPDFRGQTWFNTASGQPEMVSVIGQPADCLTVQAPATQFDKWDGSKWVTDTAAQKAATDATNNAQIKAQLSELDSKSVRALHEAVLSLAASGVSLPADTTKRLQDLETQKQALRAKLV